MLALLATIPAANVNKIQTFDSCSWELSKSTIPVPVDFAFIDGEHTNTAVARDFASVRRFLAPVAVLAFHDCFVTSDALFEISQSLRRERKANGFLYFPDSKVVAVVLGSANLRQTLLNAGWRDGLPYSYSRWHQFTTSLRMHFPRSWSVARRCKRYWLGTMHE